jgi:hypothetical protein
VLLTEIPTLEQLEKMAIAVAFHDLGIWTDHTFRIRQSLMQAGSSSRFARRIGERPA